MKQKSLIILLFLSMFILTQCSKNVNEPSTSPPEDSEIILTPVDASIKNGERQQFTSKIVQGDGTEQNVNNQAIWSVSPGRLGSIDSNGLFKAGVNGTGIETVTVQYKNIQYKTTIAILPEGMVYIPEGEFMMGSSDGISSDNPSQQVYLDAFFMDKHEVTNLQYAAFLNQAMETGDIVVNSDVFGGRGEYPLLDMTDAQIQYHGGQFIVETEKENYPAIEITWYGAKAYAEYYGKRLPTEAEWEKAARGTDQRMYPWGNTQPNSLFCNFNNHIGMTTEVGKFSPLGDSPYGCADMAGNVSEWCEDWYSSTGYGDSGKRENPAGPSSGNYKVLRGGAYYFYSEFVRSDQRFKDRPDHLCSPYGFRCAKTPAQ